MMNTPRLCMISLLLLAGISMHSPVCGQTVEINNVRMAIKSGSSKELAKYFGEMVELQFNGDRKSYSKSQAEFKMKDFFRDFPPVDFQYVHQGNSGEGLKYAIGKYVINNGSYRIWLLFKKSNESYYIDTIDFTRE
jgi:hypothetical protein